MQNIHTINTTRQQIWIALRLLQPLLKELDGKPALSGMEPRDQ